MKRVKIYRNNEWIAMGEMEDPSTWIEEGKRDQWWGDPSALTFQIEDITQEVALNQVMNDRKQAYPTPEEFMNAFFDEGEAGIEKLRQRRSEVKARFPKP